MATARALELKLRKEGTVGCSSEVQRYKPVQEPRTSVHGQNWGERAGRHWAVGVSISMGPVSLVSANTG